MVNGIAVFVVLRYCGIRGIDLSQYTASVVFRYLENIRWLEVHSDNLITKFAPFSLATALIIHNLFTIER